MIDYKAFFRKYSQEPSSNQLYDAMKTCKNEEERYQAFKARMKAEEENLIMCNEVGLARMKKDNPELFKNDLGCPGFPRKEQPEVKEEDEQA